MRQIWTAPLLASKYATDKALANARTHLVDADDKTGKVYRVLCKQAKTEGVCDSSTWKEVHGNRPTCMVCAKKWDSVFKDRT
jgi:hypothetical protein